MTRPMTEADVLAAATARISRPSAERDAITALVHWRRVEQGGADVLSDEWYDAFQVVRDAADRLIEVDAYQVTEATSEQIVREHVEVFDLPGPLVGCPRCAASDGVPVTTIDEGDAWRCPSCGVVEAGYPGPFAPRESAALTEHEAGVDAFVSRPEFGGGL
jgi:hypothetical protein